MCGFIAGKNIRNNLSKEIESISYRGLPGLKGYIDDGQFQFAHYSLPFTNLDPNVAIQPIILSNNTPALFVGEIFNWKDLTKPEYQSRSDAQFIGEYYLEYGLDAFHNFDGFWSFITIKDDDLLVVTDFLGIKPVYYRTDMEVFASEIDILTNLSDVTVNELFMSNVAKWGYDPTGGTPWNEIKQIQPGHYYHKGQTFQYWDWNKVNTGGSLYDDLKESVRLRLGGEREVSVLLSGGLDSSIIYRLIEECGYNIKAIHIENHERNYAALLSNNLIEITIDNVSDEESILIHQSPVDLGSVKPQIAMARKLKELGFHAVLTGDGADEIFGGYRRAKEYDSQYSDVFCELPYYHLPKLDRTMMFSTIELRAPFLSPKVIKHGLNTPYFMRNGEKKRLKKEFGHLIPDEILNRDKFPLKTNAIRKDPMKERMNNLKLWKEIYYGRI